MKRIDIISGSRADRGMLEIVRDALLPYFAVGWEAAEQYDVRRSDADMILVLGDRFEILRVVLAAHLCRKPVAHIAGGDVTEGSYDDAMRDCISRMASIHFVTSTSAMARLTHMGLRNVHLVGNPSVDLIKRGDWRQDRPIKEPYIVINCQPETLSERPAQVMRDLLRVLPVHPLRVYVRPNPDRGSDEINRIIDDVALPVDRIIENIPHNAYLNLLAHCDLLAGNSSSLLYEAPELGIKTLLVGNRQKGRTIPWGDGHAAQRIANILRYTA